MNPNERMRSTLPPLPRPAPPTAPAPGTIPPPPTPPQPSKLPPPAIKPAASQPINWKDPNTKLPEFKPTALTPTSGVSTPTPPTQTPKPKILPPTLDPNWRANLQPQAKAATTPPQPAIKSRPPQPTGISAVAPINQIPQPPKARTQGLQPISMSDGSLGPPEPVYFVSEYPPGSLLDGQAQRAYAADPNNSQAKAQTASPAVPQPKLTTAPEGRLDQDIVNRLTKNGYKPEQIAKVVIAPETINLWVKDGYTPDEIAKAIVAPSKGFPDQDIVNRWIKDGYTPDEIAKVSVRELTTEEKITIDRRKRGKAPHKTGGPNANYDDDGWQIPVTKKL